MEPHHSAIVKLTIFLAISFPAYSLELKVGGDRGWVIPPSNDEQFFNYWASLNRFQVNDTLRFEYSKDSVMMVTKEDYDRCQSTHPMFFSNNGNSLFRLDGPGLFYFISGVSGHCERGLKIIIKVLEPENLPDQASNRTIDGSPDGSGCGSVKMIRAATSSSTVFLFVMSVLGYAVI